MVQRQHKKHSQEDVRSFDVLNRQLHQRATDMCLCLKKKSLHVPAGEIDRKYFKEKSELTHLNLLASPHAGGKNVKTFRWEHRLPRKTLVGDIVDNRYSCPWESKDLCITFTAVVRILGVEDEQADAGRDGRTCLARPNSQAGTGAGKNAFSLFS